MLVDKGFSEAFDFLPEQTATIEIKTKQLIGPQNFVDFTFCKIDPNKTYELRGEFRATGQADSKFYFGAELYTEKKELICLANCNYYPDTETTLELDCEKGQDYLIVKSAPMFRINPSDYVGFGSQIPNFDIVKGVKSVSQESGFWKVQLSSKVPAKHDANTIVRQYIANGGHEYFAWPGWKLQRCDEPGPFHVVRGRIGPNEQYKFRAGSQFARILLYANYGQDEKSILQFRNINFQEVPENCTEL